MSRSLCVALVIVSISIICMSSRVAAQIVTNPGFEAVQIATITNNPADVPGWTHAGAAGDALLFAVGYSDSSGNVTVAGEGRQFAVMGGGFGGSGSASWTQTITGFTSGNVYRLNFMMASEAPGLSQQMTVSFPSGSSTAPQNFSAAASSAAYWRNWEEKSMDFTATAASVNLVFSTTTLQDVGLDNVRITPVPEPSCAALAAVAMGILSRRRG